MKALVVIFKEVALQLKTTILNPSLIVLPYQVASSLSLTPVLSCTSCNFYSRMNRNNRGQLTSLYRKNVDKIKLQLCGHWPLF